MSFLDIKWTGHGVNHPPPSGTKVNEKCRASYTSSPPSVPSWHIAGWTSSFSFLPLCLCFHWWWKKKKSCQELWYSSSFNEWSYVCDILSCTWHWQIFSYTFHTLNNLRPLIFLICFSLVSDVASADWNVCTLNVISWPSLCLALCPSTFDRDRPLSVTPEAVLIWHFCDRPMMQTKCHVNKEIWSACAVSFFLCLLASCIVLLQWFSGLFQHFSLVQYLHWRKYICPTQLIPFYKANSYTF